MPIGWLWVHPIPSREKYLRNNSHVSEKRGAGGPVYLTPGKPYCGFVNWKSWESASLAAATVMVAFCVPSFSCHASIV